ncbi:MAG: ABC transporter permease [Verrucomicrobia bacterium]|nr:ABC transporter permease [Verrucomicrobiota bacterium]
MLPFRPLLKNPGFTAVAVLTLALGIGATTAIFSVVHAVLLNPYPYARPGEIWVPGLRTTASDERLRPYRLDEYQDMTRMPAFSDVMATAPGEVLLTGEQAPETLRAVQLTGNAMGFLGVPPVLGRTIGASDFRPGGEPEPVVVLSHRLWQRLFAGRPDALGRTLRLNDQVYTVIGVMPSRFGWWTSDGVWLPMDSRRSGDVFPIARLRSGTGPAVAVQQLQALQAEWARRNPAGFPREPFTTELTNYLDVTAASGEMQRSLRLLFGASGFLLLIACANVANLQLARASSRAREMAVRLALGAPRRRLLGQLLAESVVLSLVGGGLGLLFAFGITRLMVTLMPGFYVPNEARIELNGWVLLFSVAVSMGTGIVFGMAPALQATRPDLTEALKDEARGSSGTAGGRIRASLVVIEVALSVVLLACAALTVRGFVALQQVPLGFQPERVLTATLPLSPRRYDTWEQRNRFAADLLERVERLPGVASASIGNGGAPFGGPVSAFAMGGQPAPENQRMLMLLAGPEYLKTLGVPLRRGRMFTAREVQDGDRVAVINEAAARLWPEGEDPVGRILRLNQLGLTNPGAVRTPAHPSSEVTVIGVMADIRNAGLREEPRPAALVPYTLAAPPARDLTLRVHGDSESWMNTLRAQVREMDPEQPLRGPFLLMDSVAEQSVQPRFTMALFTLFAAFGLTLSVAGIYSVLSYLVVRRTREIGVRMALGATAGDVLRLFLVAGGRLVLLGLALGGIAALATSRLVVQQLELFQVGAFDPVSLLAVSVLILLVAAAACYWPARRATRVDPMVALRAE